MRHFTSSKRRRRPNIMGVAEAYALLELCPGVDHEQVHATYRRLALQYHPDRNQNRVAELERFKQINAAYRVLQNKFRLDGANPGQTRDECDLCGEYALLSTALDGSQMCAVCLGRATRRPLLPAPPITVVSCASTIVLLTLAISCLAAGWFSQQQPYPAAAMVLGALALLSLAITCLTVVYTAEPKGLTRRRSAHTLRIRQQRA